MNNIQTDRLNLRYITANDASFIKELFNEPAFIKNIGDRNIRHAADAAEFIRTRYFKSYEENGYGPFAVELKASRIPIGFCGLFKRDIFRYPDLGSAFLSRYWAQGYALESADAVIGYAREKLRLPTLVAITSADNTASLKILQKLGFIDINAVYMAGYDDPSRVFYRRL